MRIYNPTGNSYDTIVYDDYGNRVLGICKIEISPIEPNTDVTVRLTFENVKLDLRIPDDNITKLEDTLWVPPTDEQKQAYLDSLNYGAEKL